MFKNKVWTKPTDEPEGVAGGSKQEPGPVRKRRRGRTFKLRELYDPDQPTISGSALPNLIARLRSRLGLVSAPDRPRRSCGLSFWSSLPSGLRKQSSGVEPDIIVTVEPENMKNTSTSTSEAEQVGGNI